MPVIKVNTIEKRFKANTNPNDSTHWAKLDR